jgi:hypothetical protein
MFDGKVGTFSRKEERARTPGHEPVILHGKIKANNGIYPAGLLLTRLLGELIALVVIALEALGVGDNATKAFDGTLAAFPVEPGTVVITDGVETFSDDGHGTLTGDAGGTGTINYQTGDWAVSFNANVGLATPITGDYITAFAGINDQETDTSKEGSCLYVGHGTVSTPVLKVGIAVPVEPSPALLMIMQRHGVYPV